MGRGEGGGAFSEKADFFMPFWQKSGPLHACFRETVDFFNYHAFLVRKWTFTRMFLGRKWTFSCAFGEKKNTFGRQASLGVSEGMFPGKISKKKY